MPHLPPVEIGGGSVKLRLPIDEVGANGRVVQTLFENGSREIETYPEIDDKAERKESSKTTNEKSKRYRVQSYSTPKEADAYIYLVEIYGEDADEVFEFRPKEGKCKLKIYFATEEEAKEVEGLMDERRWPNTVKKLAAEGRL